jgi:hypothetical protein
MTELREARSGTMRTRLRRVVTVASMAIAATVATSTIGVGQANALTGWTPYTVIAQSQATVGSVTATAQIRRGTQLNTYYTKITCSNWNPATTIRVAYGSSWSVNIGRGLGYVGIGSWGSTTATPWSALVWVGYWTG